MGFTLQFARYLIYISYMLSNFEENILKAHKKIQFRGVLFAKIGRVYCVEQQLIIEDN